MLHWYNLVDPQQDQQDSDDTQNIVCVLPTCFYMLIKVSQSTKDNKNSIIKIGCKKFN